MYNKTYYIDYVCIYGTFGGCKKKEESILPSANNVQETTNKTENTKVSEDIKIDKEYLEKKYPGKTVLTWVYTEIENMSKKERKNIMSH